MSKQLKTRIISSLIVSAIIGLAGFLSSMQSRVTANEYEVKGLRADVKDVKKDTSTILCIVLHEQSECRK